MVKEKYAKDCQQNVFLIHMKSRLCLTLHFLSGNEEFEEKKTVKITIWVIKLLSIESDSDCNQICAIFIKSMCNITLVQYKVSWQMAINMYLCNNYYCISSYFEPQLKIKPRNTLRICTHCSNCLRYMRLNLKGLGNNSIVSKSWRVNFCSNRWNIMKDF